MKAPNDFCRHVSAISIGAACAVGLGLSARRNLLLITVEGASMDPTLLPGDRILVRRMRRGARLNRGAVVAFAPPKVNLVAEDPTPPNIMVKRLIAVAGDPIPQEVKPPAGGSAQVPAGFVVVLGDSPRSWDSRSWGLLPEANVIGSALLRLSH